MLESFAPELVWFLIGLILLLGELALPAFVIMFFGIGAWITSFAVFVGIAPYFYLQLIIFSCTSLLTLILFRKQGKRFAIGRVSGSSKDVASIDTFVGSFGVVVEDIKLHQVGKVELNGTNWKAVSDVAIQNGTTVEVISSENITLKVKPRS